MGHSKRRRRAERETRQEQERSSEQTGERYHSSSRKSRRAANGTESVPARHEAGLPDVLGSDRHFWKFALAFLIIFVLLWLLAPDEN
ncbi:hypothetical protein [Tumebacillus permanentifrigoris]|uniref:Uncharacterized protein n=1 Tax=Tumebacillus permanentifrigoris TaxID=378543 RepID=A0A316DDT9_9BACL|nr:hypothetical protein [Tumebacillus permanentifrigoris]PWK16381.1 hypothetical protein C7459_101245 [Tumebacillus permanentifrigoris]